MIEYKHEYSLIVIYHVILPDGAFTSFKCPYCGFISIANNNGNLSVFSQGSYSPNCNTTVQHVNGNQPMPSYTRTKKTARLIYEPSLQGYSLSFSYNKDIVEFIKKAIPSNKRTYDPTSYTWYFGSEYFDLVKLLFDGHREYTLAIVSEDEVKKKIEEQANATQNHWTPLLQKFRDLLLRANVIHVDPPLTPMKVIENWTKDEATRFYKKAAVKLHPDLNNGQDVGMSDLTSTWSILKEGYYIK